MTFSPTSFTDKNLYAYCDNNPVIRADQDGEFAHIVIGAGFEIASQLVANGGDIRGINVGKVLVATAVGGITAATGPLMGAVISGTGNMLIESMNENTNTRKVLIAGAVGFGSSMMGAGVGKVAEKIGGKIAVKSLAKKGSGVIKKTVLGKFNVKGADRNAFKNLLGIKNNNKKLYNDLSKALLGKSIPQTFNSLATGASGYGTMGAIYGYK